MAEFPVITDPRTAAADRLNTLTKVMTTKAAIAQTPKELVWTLNKGRRLTMDIQSLIRKIPDYPRPGETYYDLTTLLADGRGFHGDTFVSRTRECQSPLISPDSRL